MAAFTLKKDLRRVQTSLMNLLAITVCPKKTTKLPETQEQPTSCPLGGSNLSSVFLPFSLFIKSVVQTLSSFYASSAAGRESLWLPRTKPGSPGPASGALPFTANLLPSSPALTSFPLQRERYEHTQLSARPIGRHF